MLSDTDEDLSLNGYEEININAIDFDFGPTLNANMDVKQVDEQVSKQLNPIKVDTNPDGCRGQIDTGAWATVTGFIKLLHNFVRFDRHNRCPIKLLPASKGSDVTPIGYGYLHVPAENEKGFLTLFSSN
mmetsp:Transcript_12848/g.19683  ORF Transcript_12848/g.19683 Transcript_12848/m.19683 type:complete len:129 (+) Transcript_12848:211-597(+)